MAKGGQDRDTCPSQEVMSPSERSHNSSYSSNTTPGSGDGETPTPTRKNKRKMSEPRKRTNITKRFCAEDSPENTNLVTDDTIYLPGVRELPPNTPEPSPGSDERSNSTGTAPSPSPVLIPPGIPQAYLGSMATGIPMYPTPVMTTVGGVPRYALLPGLPPGFLTPPGFLPPGFSLPPGMAYPSAPVCTVTTQQQLSGQHSSASVPGTSTSTNSSMNISSSSSKDASPSNSIPSPSPSVSSVTDSHTDGHTPTHGESRKQRKNYKNMTRERRVEANARERTRVHTISAAFEGLRRAVPSYSYHQRLSKLAILRIACSYILALSRLADQDYSEEQSGVSFSECVDLCTQTIQSEGRAKRRH